MRDTAIRALAALVIGACLFAVGGRAATVPAQAFDPAKCQDDDKDCITGWYNEYSKGILDEFKYYSAQQDFVAQMLATPNDTLINSRLSLVMIEGGMRFDQWVALKDDEAAKLAGLDMVKYHTISGECRDAVEAMRDAVLDLHQRRAKVPADLAAYRKTAKVCEKAFGIVAPRSKPAETPAPEADGSDSDAAPAPMVITPARKRTR